MYAMYVCIFKVSGPYGEILKNNFSYSLQSYQQINEKDVESNK